MLNIRDLSLHYGRSRILQDISMTAEQGRVTCVVGTNGVGKTSLLRAIAGTHPRSGGALSLDGAELPVLPAYRMAQAGVGYVPQGRDIFPFLTVRENLMTGFACLPRNEHEIPQAIFEMFPVLKQMENRRGGDLSGGQQQQLAIGRALITRPKLLLLDEPTEGIQPNIIQQIGEVIRHLRETGDMAIILVEQFFDFLSDLGDHFVAMKQGRVIRDAPASEVSPEELRSFVTI